MTSPLIVLERAVLLHEHLEVAGIPHALGGALALAFHVEAARGTRDIDLNVTIDPEHPESLFEALPEGLPWTAGDVEQVRRSGQVRLLWPHPDGPPTQPIPVDLFTPQDDFHAVVASRTELVPMLGTTVPIISATDLTIFKALFDRSRDWADIEELLRYGRVDLEEVRQWLVAFVGAEDHRLARLEDISGLVGTPRTEVDVSEVWRKPRLGD